MPATARTRTTSTLTAAGKIRLPPDCAAWQAAGHTLEAVRSQLRATTTAEVSRHMLARQTFVESFLVHPGVRRLFAAWGQRTGLAAAAAALHRRIAKDVQSAHHSVSQQTARLAASFKSHYEAVDPVPLVNDAIAFILGFRSQRRGPQVDELVLVWPWLALDLVAAFHLQVAWMTRRPVEIEFFPPVAPKASFTPRPLESYAAMMDRLSRFSEEQRHRYHQLWGTIPATTAGALSTHARWFYWIEVCGEAWTSLATQNGCTLLVVQRRLDTIRRLFDLSPYTLQTIRR